MKELAKDAGGDPTNVEAESRLESVGEVEIFSAGITESLEESIYKMSVLRHNIITLFAILILFDFLPFLELNKLLLDLHSSLSTPFDVVVVSIVLDTEIEGEITFVSSNGRDGTIIDSLSDWLRSEELFGTVTEAAVGLEGCEEDLVFCVDTSYDL
jgi:hypothetical protein